ncbi:MAG: FAD-containing monooxygenase EthA [Candidatus Muproteobacteria bacterium RBG_16_60_9]|uniref:FAD-containing monooxygenase EthA n=1 Tax=Candidatus Muproteobacteria bacterium RBG_16_60_9 TaxID=1817755 RepID=A0A1F6VGJ8_9PROT|nr:MAG: FAD-containing monooxygenase EthA [Candidatus Muproteobacteria bacterium RBG_16_60_9]
MTTEYFDVVIVGAGLSGVGAAYHLQDQCPGKRYVILEGRDSMGGTWDLFRYPGVRSDSDMHTLGYNFKPWREAKAIADGPSILNYVKETAAENGIDKHIRYRHRVKRAAWSTADAAWTVEAERTDTDQTVRLQCNFLSMCAGYYSYEHGYAPEFKGRERFKGKIVHPQEWPEDLEYRGKKVVVIGSGATAVTLVPEMAKDAEHVVMLQRSPTYVVSRPDKDTIANFLRKILPVRIAYAITRWKNTAYQQFVYKRTRTNPEKIKRILLDMVRKELGPDYDVATHFTPRYDPWDQRLCLVPNSDLFLSIKSGKTSVVTDQIDSFSENGIRLTSGQELPADIIVTATGLDLVVLGGAQFAVDGKPVNFPETYSYKGMMYSDVPNLVSTFGYINASWTLRADLTAEYVCRLINHMDERGTRRCTPRLREQDRNMPARRWIDGFSSGYMQRVMHLFPKQGDREPWINPQNYGRDKKMIRHGAIEDGVLIFDNPAPAVRPKVSRRADSEALTASRT